MERIDIGDVVILKSGGIKMTVFRIISQTEVECGWQEKGSIQKQIFPIAVLVKYEPPTMTIGSYV